MKKALVTGATGHLGFNLCLELKKKYNVFAFCRKNSNIKRLQKNNIKIIYGDVTKFEDFYSASIGKNYIIHAAAIYSHDEKLRDITLDTAIKSAENFCKLFLKLKIDKGIYISSVSVLGLNYYENIKKNLKIINSSNDPYVNSKLTSYKIVKDEIKKYKFPISLVLPSSMIGLNDFRITPSTSNIKNMIKTPIGIYVNGGINLVNVTDVCKSIALILKKKNNKTYILSGHNIKIKDLVKKVRQISNRIDFSLMLSKSFFIFLYNLFKYTGLNFLVPFPLNINQIKNIGKFSYFDSVDAKREKLFKNTPLEKTLRQCIRNLDY
ncbi:NAD-dependent epimerase/dehydratase family protein [Candidatus Pelagibacter sp. HIMB1746]|uniref:NAD-dependent epimerase/dehydratase family protein n=1 Tax=Candidatus Pelagibacter sp. HIMB1746 TaxID=3413370 RepID=UPI003F849E2C